MILDLQYLTTDIKHKIISNDTDSKSANDWSMRIACVSVRLRIAQSNWHTSYKFTIICQQHSLIGKQSVSATLSE